MLMCGDTSFRTESTKPSESKTVKTQIAPAVWGCLVLNRFVAPPGLLFDLPRADTWLRDLGFRGLGGLESVNNHKTEVFRQCFRVQFLAMKISGFWVHQSSSS